MRKCLMCDTDLDASVYSGGENGLRFCNSCFRKLELLEVDVYEAEGKLKEVDND